MAESIINFQETINQMWWGSLAGIFSITKRNATTPFHTHGNECLETWQFNAAGMGLQQHTQLGSSTLGTACDLHMSFVFTSLAHERRNTWDGFSGNCVGQGTSMPMVPASKWESNCLSSPACHSCPLGTVMRFL